MKWTIEMSKAELERKAEVERVVEKRSTQKEANRYLPEFIADYNRRFAVQPISNIDFHRPLDQTIDLDFLFSVHDFRKISKTLQFSFGGKVYQILTNHPPYYYASQEVLITYDVSEEITAWFNGNLLTLKEVEKRPKQTPVVSAKSTDTKPLPPAYDHPWRTYGKKINGKPVLTTLSTE